MSKVETVKGILRTFAWITREEWNEMDRKFYKIAGGLIAFAATALFWFYFLRNITAF